jgi:hypothetical protein
MSDTNKLIKYPPLTNELFVNFNGDYLFSVYGTCIDVATQYKINYEKKEIDLAVLNISPNKDCFKNIKNEFFLAISAHNAIELKDYTYYIETKKLANLDIVGWLPRIVMKSDAQIISFTHDMGQYKFELDAPNLRELELDKLAYKIMKLSPETKPYLIKTNGRGEYIHDPFDPRSYDYGPDI